MAQVRSRLYVGVHLPEDDVDYMPSQVWIRSKRKDQGYGGKFCSLIELNDHILVDLADNEEFRYDLETVARTAFNLGREFEMAQSKKRKR